MLIMNNLVSVDFRGGKKKPLDFSTFSNFDISAINFISRYENWNLKNLQSRIDLSIKFAYSNIRTLSDDFPKTIDWYPQEISVFESRDIYYETPDLFYKNYLKQEFPFVEDSTNFILSLFIQTFADRFNGKYSLSPTFKELDRAMDLAIERGDEDLFNVLEQRAYLIKHRRRICFYESNSEDDFSISSR